MLINPEITLGLRPIFVDKKGNRRSVKTVADGILLNMPKVANTKNNTASFHFPFSRNFHPYKTPPKARDTEKTSGIPFRAYIKAIELPNKIIAEIADL
jgi:hypothetical protein